MFAPITQESVWGRRKRAGVDGLHPLTLALYFWRRHPLVHVSTLRLFTLPIRGLSFVRRARLESDGGGWCVLTGWDGPYRKRTLAAKWDQR
jgi:hypothetical protein